MGMLDTSLSEINKVVGKKLTYDELEELLFEFGLDIKGAEGDALKIELTPDRYDMLSVQGFGRALRAYLGIEKGMPKYNVASCNSCRDEQHKIEKYPSYVEVVEPISEWPCVVAFIVKGLEFNDEKIREIIQIQEKLGELLLKKRKKGGIGIYPLDKITFPVKFTAQKPENIVFQPLEFEREINGHQILSQHPTGRKYAYICENWEKFPVFIDAKNTIMSMPPIINSHNVGKIDENTNAIFFEATGPDLLRLKQVANIFAAVFSDMGGKVYSLDVKYKTKTITTPDMSPFVREVSIKNAEKVLGVKLSKDEAIKLLQRMMYDVKDARAIKNEKGEIVDEIITLLAPAFRTDLLHEIDIIDDIGRAYGYDNIKPTFPNVSTVGSTLPKSDFCEKISEIFVGLGFQEIVTFILTNTQSIL
ncbi:MAG: phenylalanine--tRNA ligase subunit beta [Euryarchaeota archaeon HGW-Euryarchaeota-1]|nr:MAG: phenylalanine--tRNA ligase subunit beta [Euryarchaeota archaeon HGW-Euryarchaeota-1]